MSRVITLNEAQLSEAKDIAERQYLNAKIGGNQNQHGLPKDQGKERDVEIAFQGLCGEIAVATLLGVPWNPWLEKQGDIGRAIEVRTTVYPRGRLIWRPGTDKVEHAYLLVRSTHFPDHEIVGWIVGRDIPLKGFFGDLCRMRGKEPRRPVWWVEEKDLSDDFEALRKYYYVTA